MSPEPVLGLPARGCAVGGGSKSKRVHRAHMPACAGLATPSCSHSTAGGHLVVPFAAMETERGGPHATCPGPPGPRPAADPEAGLSRSRGWQGCPQASLLDTWTVSLPCGPICSHKGAGRIGLEPTRLAPLTLNPSSEAAPSTATLQGAGCSGTDTRTCRGLGPTQGRAEATPVPPELRATPAHGPSVV